MSHTVLRRGHTGQRKQSKAERGCKRVALEHRGNIAPKEWGSSAGGMTACEMGESQGEMRAEGRGKRTER